MHNYAEGQGKLNCFTNFSRAHRFNLSQCIPITPTVYNR